MKKSGVLGATVEGVGVGLRLDLYLVGAFADMSRKRAKKLIDGRCVSVDGRIEHLANRVLAKGQRVEVRPPPEESAPAQPVVNLKLLYRDWPVVAVHKPPGLVSGQTKDDRRPHAEKLARAQHGGSLRLLHRLDRDTSGVLLLASNDQGAKALLEDFRNREISKSYLAIASGSCPEHFSEVCHLKEASNSSVVVVKAGGMRAETHFTTLARAPGYSLVRAKPVTGRMHQIRVQLSKLGHPIIGDALYGGAPAVESGTKSMAVPRQMLHAHAIGFTHPSSGVFTQVVSPLPDDFLKLLVFIFGESAIKLTAP